MRALVVYYSRTGNTKKIGDELAAALRADVEELKDGKNRGGPIGFIMSGREAMKKQPVTLEPLRHNPADYDMVVVGSPIWANGICTPVRTFLAQHKQEIKRAAWFCTSGSIDPKYAERGFEAMAEASGLTPAATLGMGRLHIKGEHSKMLAEFAARLAHGATR